MPKPPPIAEAVAANLAAAMAHLGVSQASVQQRHKIPQSTISRLLNPNPASPNFEIQTLTRVCDALGLDIHAMMVAGIPVSLLFSRRTAALLQNWSDAPEHAREHVEKIAEGAVKYAAGSSAMPPPKRGRA